ncbi:transporter substrate-binding domain-containing protein [Paenibacillus cellulositrophicus]|uniref:Amino acid ABC transporter n=1 Tax=Paenibacillus cineris TaxID=237530 RepID=A0ABQ4LGD2_9BACL|nr:MULTISPECIES: transporter substrate-binding domain-containing protein [Paenibacillus]MCM2999049.1 transporter substrate-binding domain-containing protein [Paenibacillus cellulositrophicus]GIO54988.1 amino acid ABC transporter [Paenibacillus cineris]
MKKWGILTACILLAGSLLAGCGSKPSTEGGTAAGEKPASGKTIVLGTSADFPPYEFHKMVNGKDQIVGFDIEIAKEIAKDMGAQLEVKDMSFDALLGELSTGRVDFVISGLTPNEERKKQIDFSNNYYKAEQAVVVREADKNKYSTMKALEGASLGIQKGSIQEDIAKTIPGAKITGLGKISDIVLQLNSSRVDASIMEKPVAEAYIKNVKGLVIADAVPDYKEDGYAIGIKKGNTELVNQINKTLDRLKSENKIEQYVAEASDLAAQK